MDPADRAVKQPVDRNTARSAVSDQAGADFEVTDQHGLDADDLDLDETMNQAPKAGTERTSGEAERALLVRHLDGDPMAFGELVQAYRAPVFGYLVRCGICDHDRDDLFQDIFIKIHRAAPTFHRERPLHPWLFTIVCNTVRTYLRRRRVRQLIFSAPVAEEPTDSTPDGERRSAARQTVAFLEGEIRRLPLAHREVLLLAAVDRRPLKDVSEALGVPLNTVKTRLRRARLALAQALAKHNLPREAQ